MNNHFGICFSQAKTPLAESVSLGEINSHTLLFSVYNTVTSEVDNCAANAKHFFFLSFPALSDQVSSLQRWPEQDQSDFMANEELQWKKITQAGRQVEKKFDYKYNSFGSEEYL